MTKSNGSPEKPPVQSHAITTLSVAGFKSIFDEQTIEIRPLTLLAGANSSGKSSMMQPLLLAQADAGSTIRSWSTPLEWSQCQIHFGEPVLAVAFGQTPLLALRRHGRHVESSEIHCGVSQGSRKDLRLTTILTYLGDYQHYHRKLTRR